MNKDNSTIGALILIFNILVSLGIGLISFGILASIFGIHIWVISISFGIMLILFAFSFVIEKITGIFKIKRN